MASDTFAISISLSKQNAHVQSPATKKRRLVGCPKKSTEVDWFGRMQFFIGANSLLLGEMSLSKKEKLVVLPTSYSGSSLLEEGLLECKTL